MFVFGIIFAIIAIILVALAFTIATKTRTEM